MKRLLALSVWLLLTGAFLNAQSTTVSSTGLVDSDGFTWANGTVIIDFVPAPNFPNISSYGWIGGALKPQYTTTLNGSGALSVSVPSTTAISPSGSTWQFNFCPNATKGCFQYNLATIGSTMDITTALNAVLPGPRFPYVGTSTNYGYGPVELSTTVPIGAQFFNTTTVACQQYNGSTWQGCGTGGGSMTWPSAAGITVYAGSDTWGTSLTKYGTETGSATSADPGTTANVPIVSDGSHGIEPSASGALGTGAFTAAYILPAATTSALGGVSTDAAGTLLNSSGAIAVAKVPTTNVTSGTYYLGLLASSSTSTGQAVDTSTNLSVSLSGTQGESWITAGGGTLSVTIPSISSSESLAYPAITSNDTIADLAGTQTLTNKTIAGGSNTISGLTGSMMANNTVGANQLAMQYSTVNLGTDGIISNAALPTSGFPATPFGLNSRGVTETITSIKCAVDSGSSTTVALTDGSGDNLLSGSTCTCSTTWASCTQSGTYTTIASGGYMKVTYTPDGTAKAVSLSVGGTY
jgi:hypothetical protein